MSSHGGNSQSCQREIDILTDEIDFQRGLLYSLESPEDINGVENLDEAKKQVRNELRRLRNDLENLQDTNRASPSRQDSKAGSISKSKPMERDYTDSADSDGSDNAEADLDPFSRRHRPIIVPRKMQKNELPRLSSDSEVEITFKSPSPSNNMEVNKNLLSKPGNMSRGLFGAQSISSTASTPTSNTTDSIGEFDSHKMMDLPTRKRSHSTHLGFPKPTASNKSRRTSASPHPTRSPTPNMISSGDEALAAFDSKYFTDAEQVAKAKMEQEKHDAEYARHLSAQFAAESANPSSSKFAFNQTSGYPHPYSSQYAASSSRNVPYKAEYKSEPTARSLMYIQKSGNPQMPGSFGDTPEDDDSDLEIIDASHFRDNGRNSTAKTKSNSALQIAIYGKKEVPNWMSPQQGNSGPSKGYVSAIGEVSLFDAKMPGAFPDGSMHDLDFIHTQSPDFSDYGFDEMDNLLRTKMESGLDMYDNPLDPLMQAQFNYVVNDPRKTDEEIRTLLSNIRPDEDLPKENREGTPEGMAYPLYEHQKLALTWLKNMEDSKSKGSILADDMGLGKTISALALMVSKPSMDYLKRTTLIIAPVALVRQWEREIKMKLKPISRLSVLNMHGKKQSWDSVRTFDVVLTTYGTLGAEFKRYEKYELKKTVEKQPMDQNEMKNSFPLFSLKSHFHRIILDEAQCIKNKNTVAARACHQLKATYRLVLTGTPMMNNPGELYSLIRFLRIKPYDELTRFQDAFSVLTKGTRNAGGNRNASGDPKKALAKLQILLKAILLRRTKTSLIDGQPIINLPPKTEEIQHVVFDEDEQAFYQALENKTKLQFNKYMKAGTVGKNYSNVLVLLLRLRQACCHPHLIQEFETAPSAMASESMVQLAKTLSPQVIARIIAAEGIFMCPICYDGVANPSILLPCGHDACTECLSRVTDQAAQDNAANDVHGAPKCPCCRVEIDLKKVIDFITFKKVHQPSQEDIDTASEHSDSQDSDSDSESDDEEEGADVDSDGDLRGFIVPDDLGESESDNEKEGSIDLNGDDDATLIGDDSDFSIAEDKLKAKKPQKLKRKRSSFRNTKGKAKEKRTKKEHLSLAMLKTEANKSAKGKAKYMKHLRRNWQPSAKITKCVDLIEQFQKDGQKTIIFSQFVSLLDLLQVPIEQKGWNVERYDGSMNAAARNDAILRFTDRPNIKIMLISLKAGNAGLNLVSASRVIILDPFWNPFIEMQAVDRAYRIGQQKPVEVHRILIEGTVEDRIIDLQKQKKEMVDAALDEGARNSFGRLGEQQLAYLFGVGGKP